MNFVTLPKDLITMQFGGQIKIFMKLLTELKLGVGFFNKQSIININDKNNKYTFKRF
jgi:hypothetical protein